VAHVGDRDPEPKALAFLLAVNRVVEVPGRLAVDGDERELAQILPSLQILLAHRVRGGLRLCQRPLRELVRQVELAHRDLDLHAGIGVVAEHLGDAPDRLGVAAGRRHEIDRHDLPRLGAARLGARHQDVVRDAPVVRHEKQHPVLRVHASDDAALRALEHLDHGPDRAAAVVASADAHRRTIAVHHLAHLRRRQEHRRPALVGHQESVAVGMALDASGDQRDALRDQQRSGAVLHHLARALERGQRLVERAALAPLDLEALRELGARERRAGAVQRVDDLARVFRRRGLRPLCPSTSAKRCFSCLFL
jgi:hypothetical protein